MTELSLQHDRSGTTWGYAASGLHRLGALWRRWIDRQAEASRLRRELRALDELSDATLRDIGRSRSELGAILADLDGRATATRTSRHDAGSAPPRPPRARNDPPAR